jgi:hypothetical protein
VALLAARSFFSHCKQDPPKRRRRPPHPKPYNPLPLPISRPSGCRLLMAVAALFPLINGGLKRAPRWRWWGAGWGHRAPRPWRPRPEALRRTVLTSWWGVLMRSLSPAADQGCVRSRTDLGPFWAQSVKKVDRGLSYAGDMEQRVVPPYLALGRLVLQIRRRS